MPHFVESSSKFLSDIDRWWWWDEHQDRRERWYAIDDPKCGFCGYSGQAPLGTIEATWQPSAGVVQTFATPRSTRRLCRERGRFRRSSPPASDASAARSVGVCSASPEVIRDGYDSGHQDTVETGFVLHVLGGQVKPGLFDSCVVPQKKLRREDFKGGHHRWPQLKCFEVAHQAC